MTLETLLFGVDGELSLQIFAWLDSSFRSCLCWNDSSSKNILWPPYLNWYISPLCSLTVTYFFLLSFYQVPNIIFYIVLFIILLFSIFFTWKVNPLKALFLFCSMLNLQYLEHSRCSVHICWINYYYHFHILLSYPRIFPRKYHYIS